MEDKTDPGNTAIETTENTTATPKKPMKSKSKAQREKKSPHPPTAEMVTAAIKELKDRKGSSLQAIKKYIATTYNVNGEKVAPFIKRYLKSAITSGAVVQTKGKGASGSFKLSTGKPSGSVKVKASPRTVKKAAPKRAQSVEKKTVSKKAAPPKKPVTTKKAAVQKKAAAPKKTAAKPVAAKPKATSEVKTMSKSKKSAKAPAAKTKAPKPKKAVASKSVKSSAKK